MLLIKQIRQGLLLLLALGCSSPGVIDQDIVRPGPDEPYLEKIPGPLLKSFNSVQDALLAACDKIIVKPNAVAGRRDQPNFDIYWRVGSEYCAWIYYTPDQKYELSKLTDQSRVDPANRRKTCHLPPVVEDRRHPPESIKYICALHNHLFDDPVSPDDVKYIVSQVHDHGFESETKDGVTRLSTVVFFSNNRSAPTCDGFYQYIPATSQILKWTHEREGWGCEQTGRVIWLEGDMQFSIEEMRAPCPKGAMP
ncbi:MAG: hypothetical protein ACJ8AT_16075 [Hyalangium sp.]|uniref:hypothetical protein n=1 Tax=Hyalangium sp. TaxID=2028555 RepID=UPI00389AA906